METLLNVPQGTFEIQRLPYRKNETLRAWDAADEYLLQYVSEQESLAEESRLLILNDKFGALVTVLNNYNLVAISDSWLSQQATRINLEANGITQSHIQLNSSINWPNQTFDLVLIKTPKTLALLEDQLIHLQAVITENTIIVAAGMVKAMSANVWKMLEKYIGPTKPSQAKKKARLIFVDVMVNQQKFKNPYPVYYTLEKRSYRICNHANVFSRTSLDIGTRFLLEHLPKNTAANDIIDLGCGNGVVGLMLAESHPSTLIHFVDESYMAVASAKENFNHAYPNRKAEFYITDGLTEFEAEMADLIICNPPFHQQNTVGDQIAISMFKQSYRVLRQGGSLWVIGNRHLGYHINLKRLFSNCKEIAANKKFVIWQVKKTMSKSPVRQVVLDTETTGLNPREGHKIIEIGCVELIDRRLTKNTFHVYLNPDREIDAGAIEVHGISNEFLQDKPRFRDIVDDYLAFTEGAELVIHNAPFDVGFLNHELALLKGRKTTVEQHSTVFDTLPFARNKYPGARASLDALCKRFGIDNSHRELHGALLDAEILADVYLAMTGGQYSLMDFNMSENVAKQGVVRLSSNRAKLKVISCTTEERDAHRNRLEAIKQSSGFCLWNDE